MVEDNVFRQLQEIVFLGKEQQNAMLINSYQELENLFAANPCVTQLPEESYRKTRFLEGKVFDELLKYTLNFEPFIEMSKRCGMNGIPIMKSVETNRLYIGIINLGGHRPNYEVRPVRLVDVLDVNYIEKMYQKWGYEFGLKVDNQQEYKI